jgi:hypothetical protein
MLFRSQFLLFVFHAHLFQFAVFGLDRAVASC